MQKFAFEQIEAFTLKCVGVHSLSHMVDFTKSTAECIYLHLKCTFIGVMYLSPNDSVGLLELKKTLLIASVGT